MRLFEGTYTKKDGTKRTMRFVKKEDFPQEFANAISKGGKSPVLPDGLESVWDVEKSAFRVFNYSTLEGELTITEVANDILGKTVPL